MKFTNLTFLVLACGLILNLVTPGQVRSEEPISHIAENAKPFPKRKRLTRPPNQPQSSVVLYDNFGPNNSYDTTTSWIVGGYDSNDDQIIDGFQDVACPFTVTGSADVYLDRVDTAPAICSGANSIRIGLYTNVAGAPGQLQEVWEVNGKMGPCGNPNPLIVVYSTGTKLTRGTQYWIVLTHPAKTAATAIWSLNDQNDVGTVAFQQNNGGWHSGSVKRGAMRVVATTTPPCPVTSAIRSVAPHDLDGYIPDLSQANHSADEREIVQWRSGSLQNMRGFRDDVLTQTTDGKQLTNLYYAHARELNSLLGQQPELRQKVKSLLISTLPAIVESRSTGFVKLKPQEFDAALNLLNSCERHASPSFRGALGKVRTYLTTNSRQNGNELIISFRMPARNHSQPVWGISFSLLAIASVLLFRRKVRS